MHNSLVCVVVAVLMLIASLTDAQGAASGSSSKPASPTTVSRNQQARARLPLSDARDLEESRRGFIAAPADRKILDGNGRVVWDMARYDFLMQGRSYDSIHPSLQHQAEANMGFGLYEVVPGRIYQVRGFDISNICFIKGDTGWIVFDPLTTRETAAAALALVTEKLGKRPVLAVVYSHSHADHFGGVRGVVDEADVTSGKVSVIAPAGFMDHAASEFVYAGAAMNRRLQYQYGSFLPHAPEGHVDQAIGKTVAVGAITLIAPTRTIQGAGEELTIDGVRMVFQNTPGTEAPAEMNTWFPQFKAFWAAENITGTIHNIYTLRGALVRDALYWSKQINEALYRFGGEAEVMFASHNWPRWGNSRIQEVMRAQRDAYAHLNNWVLHLANQGVTVNEIHNVYRQPRSLQQQWAAHSYHGSEEHNSRAVINRYLGYWDGNPATLIPLSPRDTSPLYVSMMGGAEKILAKAGELHSRGEDLLAMELLNKLVYAEPGNEAAKQLLADVFEQIGYQKESSSLRNAFLAAALELRAGIPSTPAPAIGSDMLRSLTTDQLLDLAAIQLDSESAEGQRFTLNLMTPDTGETFVVELSNATLTHIKDRQASSPDATLTINRGDLLPLLAGIVRMETLIESGKARLGGDGAVLARLRGLLVSFKPDFEIMPGTRASSR